MVAYFKLLSQEYSKENKGTHKEEPINLDSLSLDQDLNPGAK
jgi:hypothetical protein